jgi:hypothetical protein
MRDINWDKPLSADDKAWAMDREELHTKVAANEARFAKGAAAKVAADPGAEAETPAKAEDDYDQWKLVELREEAAKRRPPIEVEGLKRPEIIAAMRAWDTAHPEG